jgi:hypothetical protein
MKECEKNTKCIVMVSLEQCYANVLHCYIICTLPLILKKCQGMGSTTLRKLKVKHEIIWEELNICAVGQIIGY